MIQTKGMSILLAYGIDLIVGDPKTWPHPVKMMGRFIHFLDTKLNRNKKSQGVLMLSVVLVSVAVISSTLVWGAYQIHPLFGVLIEAILIATTISQKGLKDAAMEVYEPLTENKIEEARLKVGQIVGRDTNQLDEAGIIRATIETVAENTADGITSPLFWAVLGGAPAALVYRAINTCDSMVGYKNEKYENFGWASARLDDVVNWLPARLTGVLMLRTLKANPKAPKITFSRLREEARNHASPNSGWTEAAVALLLGIQLGGTNYYQGVESASPKIGQATRVLKKEDITRTITSMQRTSLLFTILSIGAVGGYVITKTWSESALFI